MPAAPMIPSARHLSRLEGMTLRSLSVSLHKYQSHPSRVVVAAHFRWPLTGGTTFIPVMTSRADALPEDNWIFLVDNKVPENLRLPTFGKWCTSYFDHTDIIGRDLDKLSWVCAFGITVMWAVQDDEKELRSADTKPAKYRIVGGTNHFVHWDDLEKALDAFVAMA
ncbi:uncharacterized protein EV420DRAFT_1478776 [Desarmillaria tabescens]|uniref:Uncharacterized protein n=1 Tax=Armillaria tabescens TaxID=1929756 RepID=A0AA39N6R5_ARMTA|nr:uncharacterized protein EV420DRAFT_1478776 [Desarmillaria tabescens]KAK0460261.1 hypothetical protein EV420DRAFT_1478776 [Desarmillaria tabescens]